MKTQLAGAAVLSAILVAGVWSFLDDNSITVDPDSKDVKALVTAQTDGDVSPYNVYKKDRSDGGLTFVAYKKLADAGEQLVFIDHSPCRKRPLGTPISKCPSVYWDGGSPKDYSDTGNVMQPNIWIDNGGCVEVACVIMSGEAAP